MAKQRNIDLTILAGNGSECIDLSGFSNASSFDGSIEKKDCTTFADLARRWLGGAKDFAFNIDTFHDDGGQPWDTLNDIFGSAAAYFAWLESNAAMAEADFCAFGRALESNYAGPGGGAHGELQMVNVSGGGDGALVYGQVLQQDESLTVTGNSTGFQFGALATGETLSCVQFVLSVTAGSIVGTIESDDAADFVGATTEATFASATGPIVTEQTVVGPATNTWWRYEYTITTGPAVVVTLIGKK